jgi:hypothetical protein
MKDIGRGIAVAAMWGAVAVIGWQDPGYGVGAAFFAMLATGAVL